MTKDDTIRKLIKKVYDYSGKLIISRKDIKSIERLYITNATTCHNVDQFIETNGQIRELVLKLKSGKDEIDKQLISGKALQPGILAECVFMQTLAKILGLRSYIDLERTSFADVPRELAPYVQPKTDTICAARYVYYNRQDTETLIIQYGNPKAGDAAAIIYTNEVIIEIKDMPALLMDTDLIYDEEGKIIITSDMRASYPDYVIYLDEFNKNHSILDMFGSNYKLFDGESNDDSRRALLKRFFESSTIDVIITAIGKKDDIIAIKSSDVDFIFTDGEPLIYTSGSEIRTTGKNARTEAFTPIFLEKVLKDNGVVVDEDNLCRLYHNNDKVIGKIHGRGKEKTTYTRLKISHAFFVKMENVTEYDDYDEFPKDKIHQSKSGISMHIEIKKAKEEIKAELYNY